MRKTLLVFILLVVANSADGGLTVYFHGANNGGNPTRDWLTPIGESTLAASPVETDFWELRQTFSGGQFSHELVLLAGNPESAIEHVVMGNWQNHAFGETSGSRVAEAFANHLLEQNPEWLSGPIDLAGHSRGGGVIYDVARTLGQSNIGVEGLHFWDNHPVNGVAPQPYGPFDWGDSVPTHLDNVGFAVNYYQRNDTNIPGKLVDGALNVDISASGLDHSGVVSYFHGTVDLNSDRVVPNRRHIQDSWYDEGLGPRDNIGFQWTHLGENSDKRPLAGIHPALGGTGSTSLVEGMTTTGAWPWLGLTSNTRKTLQSGSFLVELAYSDPDTPVTLSVVSGDSRDHLAGTEILRQVLPASSEKLVHVLDLEIPESPNGFLHFILNDGVNTKYTSAEYRVDAPFTGDFNHDGTLDVADANRLLQEIAGATHGIEYDVTGDDMVKADDLFVWVKNLKNTWIGDANLDGEFNSGDFVDVFSAGKYETGDLARWNEGDWNGDERFDSGDFIAAFQDGGYELGTRAAVVAVPEPSGWILVSLGLLCVGRREPFGLKP